jgi:hypothetical protein
MKGSAPVSSGDRKSIRKRSSKEPLKERIASIEYIPMPEEMKDRVYDEWVRIFIQGEQARLKFEKQHKLRKEDK